MTRHASHWMQLLRRRGAVWLALCIALLGALAPTLSHALVWARGDASALVEVCTSNGPRWLALPAQGGQADNGGAANASPSSLGDDTRNPAEPRSAAVLEHCPFCLLLADRAAPPAQPPAFSFHAPGHAVRPDAPPLFFAPTPLLTAAHPRGPPTL